MSDVSFEKKLKVGDVVTAYRKGIHVIEKIARRFITESDLRFSSNAGKKIGDEYNSVVHYRQVADSKWRATKSKAIYHCDESFCELMNVEFFDKTVAALQKQIDDVRKFQKTLD